MSGVRSVSRPEPVLPERTPPAGPQWVEHRASGGPRAFMSLRVLDQIRALNGEYGPNEIAGLLIGRRFTHNGQPFVVVTDLVRHLEGEIESAPASVRILAEGAVQMKQRAAVQQPLGDVVGWWHTHPEFRAYFSPVDVAEQRFWQGETSVGLVFSGRPRGGPEWAVFLGPESAETEAFPGGNPVRARRAVPAGGQDGDGPSEDAAAAALVGVPERLRWYLTVPRALAVLVLLLVLVTAGLRARSLGDQVSGLGDRVGAAERCGSGLAAGQAVTTRQLRDLRARMKALRRDVGKLSAPSPFPSPTVRAPSPVRPAGTP